MAQNIGKRRGKSPIKTRIEMERRAENKNPGSRPAKGFTDVALFALETALYGPAGKAAKYGYKVAKSGVKKLTKTIPPKKGPVPQGLKNGGCPYRENGAKSDIQGIKDIQLKGKKFTGVK